MVVAVDIVAALIEVEQVVVVAKHQLVAPDQSVDQKVCDLDKKVRGNVLNKSFSVSHDNSTGFPLFRERVKYFNI